MPAATPVLDHLRAVPGGFGQPTFAAFLAALVSAVQARATAGRPPPVLFLMGEPLAGKSTFLSELFARLTGGPPAPGRDRTPPSRRSGDQARGPMVAGGSGRHDGIRPYLIRWGDAIRAAKKVGRVAPERQFGDLTPEEFSRTSQLVAEAADDAARAATGGPPALVVVEAPGVTAITGEDGALRGLDRGYSFARVLARRPDGFLMALAADQRVRDTRLASRGEAGALDVREATQLAANRIRRQVTDLLFELASRGTIRLPEPAPVRPLTRASLDEHPEYRNEAVLRAYLPYLFERDLGVPAERAFIGLNGFLGEGVAVDAAILDAHDWTKTRFGL